MVGWDYWCGLAAPFCLCFEFVLLSVSLFLSLSLCLAKLSVGCLGSVDTAAWWDGIIGVALLSRSVLVLILVLLCLGLCLSVSVSLAKLSVGCLGFCGHHRGV